MKTNKFVEELKTKSDAELAQELVAAKKEHCTYSDCHHREGKSVIASVRGKEINRGKKFKKNTYRQGC